MLISELELPVARLLFVALNTTSQAVSSHFPVVVLNCAAQEWYQVFHVTQMCMNPKEIACFLLWPVSLSISVDVCLCRM